jgi:hypothetical protein
MNFKLFTAALVLAAAVPAMADGLLPAGDSFYAKGVATNFGGSPTINVGGAVLITG